MAVNTDLGAFLRTCRANTAPETAGITEPGPAATTARRVRGLRREEVAQLAGVSVDYYTRLEQGRHTTPSDAVVEVSEATLSYDRRRKGSLYARAGIADYWIVNLNRRRLEIYRQPIPDPSRHYGFGYSSVQTFDSGEHATPLAAPQAKIAVADLLP